MNTIKAKRILEALETFSRRKKRLQENYKAQIHKNHKLLERLLATSLLLYIPQTFSLIQVHEFHES